MPATIESGRSFAGLGPTASYEIGKFPYPSVENWPLSFVPGPKERGEISGSLLNTASHELHHADVLLALGEQVISLTVQPTSEYLGRTVFSGFISTAHMQIAAAAGSLPTHDGCAHGFGSDMALVDYYAHHGGISVDDAINKAREIVGKRSRDVYKKAAQIVAWLGLKRQDVNGAMVNAIFARAEMEDAYEKGLATARFVVEYQRPKQKEESNTRFTVIDNVGDRLVIKYYIGRELQKKEIFCRSCNGVNGHAEKCQFRSEPIEVFSSEFPEAA